MPKKKEEKIQKPKRKVVKVRVFKPKKTAKKPKDLPFSIDLSAGIDPTPVAVKKEVKSEVKPEAKEKISEASKEAVKKEIEKAEIEISKKEIKEEVKKEDYDNKSEQEKTSAEEEIYEEENTKKGFGVRINLYRKIAFSFIFLTLALLAIVFYFSFIKVTISVDPKEEIAGNNLIFDVYDKNKQTGDLTGRGIVAGAVEKVEIEETKIYNASGGEVIGEEAVGRAAIINNYEKSQPLVATTRLLSADGKLFRIKDTVNVPAGGSVEVDVYADKPAADMAIGPSRFTIPGLWEGLREKIYAESKEPMQYKKKEKKNISQSDIDAGIEDLKKAILVKAENSINEKYKDYSQKLYKIDDNTIVLSVDGKAGDEKEQFSITMKAGVGVVAFSDERVQALAKDKITSSLSSDKELIEFNKGSFNYDLNSINIEQGTATVNSSFEGKVSAKSGGAIVDRNKILGLSKSQLEDYLANMPGILNYEIKFSPSCIKKVPNSADRIEINIKK